MRKVLGHDTKSMILEEKIDKLDFIKIKNFSSVKDPIKRMEDFPGGPVVGTLHSQCRGY